MVQTRSTCVVTGAAGQIAYSLLPRLLDGTLFGDDTLVDIRLLDLPQFAENLSGVVLELEDLRSRHLGDVLVTSDIEAAFTGADVVICLGAFPRNEGMERKDLLAKNVSIFAEQGKVLARVAKATCKVLVVGNPANSNARILAEAAAPTIDPRNVSALTRLDQNRLHAQLAMRVGARGTDVRHAVIFGNHSSTQVPFAQRAVIKGVPIEQALPSAEDKAWMEGDLIACVQKRGAAVIQARKLSSAMSAARAIYDHLYDLLHGSDDWVSMAVCSDGSYSIPKGVFYSFPCAVSGGGAYEIVQGLEIDEHTRLLLDATRAELEKEYDDAREAIATVNAT
jgi:malate dehydrogenase